MTYFGTSTLGLRDALCLFASYEYSASKIWIYALHVLYRQRNHVCSLVPFEHPCLNNCPAPATLFTLACIHCILRCLLLSKQCLKTSISKLRSFFFIRMPTYIMCTDVCESKYHFTWVMKTATRCLSNELHTACETGIQNLQFELSDKQFIYS